MTVTLTYDIPAIGDMRAYAEPYLDDALACFRSHETPLLSLALAHARKAKAAGLEAQNITLAAEELDPDAGAAGESTTMELEAQSLGDVTLQPRGLAQAVVTWTDEAPDPDAQLVADVALAEFKRRHNRACWSDVSSQIDNLTEHAGAWAAADFLAIAKAFFTSQDYPASGVLFCGASLIEQLHAIDWSACGSVTFSRTTDPTGLAMTSVRTLYGDIDIVRDPTLDDLGWGDSGVLLSLGHLTRYKALPDTPPQGIALCDGLALEGSCHIWIDSDDE